MSSIKLKFKHAHLKFTIYGCKQAYTHFHKCNYASVGLAQARPNETHGRMWQCRVMTSKMFICTMLTIGLFCIWKAVEQAYTLYVKVDVPSNIDLHDVPYFWQLWTVALWLIQPMARLIRLLEQHLDRQPPTVVTQATTWWETVIALVKLQEIGLGVNLPVKVFSLLISSIMYVHDVSVVWLL